MRVCVYVCVLVNMPAYGYACLSCMSLILCMRVFVNACVRVFVYKCMCLRMCVYFN